MSDIRGEYLICHELINKKILNGILYIMAIDKLNYTSKDTITKKANLIDQRKSQIDVLNSMERERRDSKEFSFPDDYPFRRKRASIDHGSDDDDVVPFEVEIENFKFY